MTESNQDLDSRQKLLAAARQLLLTKGHQRATVKEIAKEAGVNHGLVHHYFKSKEHLFVELLKSDKSFTLDSVMDVIESKDASVEQVMRDLFPSARLHIEFQALSMEMPEVRDALHEFIESKKTDILQKTNISDPNVVTLLIASIAGLVMHYTINPDMPLSDILTTLHDMVFNYQDSPRTST
jgi:AcrR family transcriptional regulator